MWQPFYYIYWCWLCARYTAFTCRSLPSTLHSLARYARMFAFDFSQFAILMLVLLLLLVPYVQLPIIKSTTKWRLAAVAATAATALPFYIMHTHTQCINYRNWSCQIVCMMRKNAEPIYNEIYAWAWVRNSLFLLCSSFDRLIQPTEIVTIDMSYMRVCHPKNVNQKKVGQREIPTTTVNWWLL